MRSGGRGNGSGAQAPGFLVGLRYIEDMLEAWLVEALARKLVAIAPKRIQLPKDSLQISIDHFVQTKARGNNLETAAKVDNFLAKIRSFK